MLRSKKTPSYLEDVAETRARAAGDVLCLRKVWAELEAHLAKFERIHRLAEACAQQLAAPEAEVAAIDVLIRRFDPRLDPEEITLLQPGQVERHARGLLRDNVIDILQKAAPNEVPTPERCYDLQLRLVPVFNYTITTVGGTDGRSPQPLQRSPETRTA